jgi:uncharacterized protein YndB with AHSA1/START domain
MDSWDTEAQAAAAVTASVTTMHIRQELDVNASRRVVWDILTRRIDDWWRHPYRIQESDGTMRLELRPHGSLTEHWDDHGFAAWGQVSHLDPGRTLEFTGPCGMGTVHGMYAFHLEDRDEGVTVTLTHDAFGVLRESVQHDLDEAWRLMLLQLKELAEGELAYGADARSI